MRWTRILLAAALLIPSGSPARAGLPCTPTKLWTWDGATRLPGITVTNECPVVGRVTDTNGDGKVDGSDAPTVLFMAGDDGGSGGRGVLVALDGRDGSDRFVTPTTTRVGWGSPVLADLDRDGFPEIVDIGDQGLGLNDFLVAFDHRGALLWESDRITASGYAFGPGDAVSVADLDQDGSPELFVGHSVFSSGGRFLWQGPYRSCDGAHPLGGARGSHAGELIASNPGLELLAGGSVYSASGAIIWDRCSTSDLRDGGWTAIADLDADGIPEMILVRVYDVHVLDGSGATLGVHPLSWLDRGVLLHPVVADLDGDGQPEVVVATDVEALALHWNGAGFDVMWSLPWATAGLTSATAFDFDADGAYELVTLEGNRMRIRDGATAGILFEDTTFCSASSANHQVPVVADITGDCSPEIVLGACWPRSVVAFTCAGGAPARSVWNQFNYHVTNIADDLTVPRVEPAAGPGGNTWLAQAAGLPVFAVPAAFELTVCAGETASLDATPSYGCGGGRLEYRWLEGGIPRCDWGPQAVCAVTPSATTVYTLEVACAGSGGCAGQSASAQVVVLVIPDLRPGDLGNSLRAVRRGLDVDQSWSGDPNARSYSLYRGVAKGMWPPAALLSGLVGPTASLPDVPPPPALYFYRSVGVSCSGLEGP